MKKTFAVIISLLLMTSTKGQTTDISINIHRDSIMISQYGKIETLKSTHSEGFKTIIIDTNCITYFSFEKGDEKPKNIYKREFKSLYTSLINVEEKENGMLFFLQTEARTYFMLSHNNETNEWRKSKPFKVQGEKMLASFKHQGKIKTLHLNRKENQLTVHELNDSTSQKMASFDLRDNKLNGVALSEYLKGRNNKVKEINPVSPNELFNSTKKNKLMVFGDELRLLIDDTKSSGSAVLKINLNKNEMSVSSYSGNKTSCDSNLYNYSSLTKDYLIKVFGCKQEAKVEVWNVSKKKLVKSHSIPYESLLDFTVYDNIIGSNKKAESIDRIKPKQLIQSIMTEKGSAFAYQKDNLLFIQIGFISDQHKMKLKKIRIKEERVNGKRKGQGNGTGGGKGAGSGGGGGKGLLNHKLKVLNLNKSNSISKSYYNYLIGKPRYLVAVLDLKSNEFKTDYPYTNVFEEGKQMQLGKVSSWMYLNDLYWFSQMDVLQNLTYQSIK